MLRTRVIPTLLLRGQGLVKTVKFKDPTYVGDPRNAVKIFNEKEVDELVLLDITATVEKRKPRFDLIQEIVSEAFMPVGYGGGIRDIDDVRRLMALGVEKVIVNSYAIESPEFIRRVADVVGSSSVVVSLDVKKKRFGGYELFTHGGKKASGLDPVSFAAKMEQLGAGEIVVNAIDLDGTMKGYNIELLKSVSSAVRIPIIALGGAGKLEHIVEAVNAGGVLAAAAGSMFVFQGKHRAVLISYPDAQELKRLFH